MNSLFLSPCSELEIYSFLMRLNKNTAAGNDEIKAIPITFVANLLSAPLQHICNRALVTGIFPAAMKTARVTVLHKGGPINDFNNYRPISVLPLFSKVLENVIKTRITKFLDDHELLVCEQFGFRAKKSTEMALLGIKEQIAKNIDSKEFTLGIFLDFRKAFDSVKHDILFKKLPYYGIRGIALELVRSYLTDRLQYTCVHGYNSQLKPVTLGVPQGSILGPLFFIIYINDIVHVPVASSSYVCRRYKLVLLWQLSKRSREESE